MIPSREDILVQWFLTQSFLLHLERDCKIHATTRKGDGKKDKQSKSWSMSTFYWQR